MRHQIVRAAWQARLLLCASVSISRAPSSTPCTASHHRRCLHAAADSARAAAFREILVLVVCRRAKLDARRLCELHGGSVGPALPDADNVSRRIAEGSHPEISLGIWRRYDLAAMGGDHLERGFRGLRHRCMGARRLHQRLAGQPRNGRSHVRYRPRSLDPTDECPRSNRRRFHRRRQSVEDRPRGCAGRKSRRRERPVTRLRQLALTQYP